jgi:hypothetical protein
MSLRIESQPYNGTVNSSLSPALVAKLRVDNPTGDYSAAASLVDSSGNAVSGVIAGDFNASGRVSDSGTEVTFKWRNLVVSREGTYQVQIIVVESAPGGYVYAGSGLTDPVTITA